MSRPGEVAGDQLRTIVERIERIDEEIKELSEGKKEIYIEAKSNGFDVKVLRQVIRIRKQNQEEREEQESMLDVYLQAIKNASPAKSTSTDKRAKDDEAKPGSRRTRSSEAVSQH
jgi:uncharacterized protein (UPF0335 family)